MIGGIPNVGKSTIINSLRKRDEGIEHGKKSGARVGANPCVTKSFSGFKIISDPLVYMVDSPGIIMPKIKEDSEDGLKLSLVNSIRDGILEKEYVCDYLLYKLNKEGVFNYCTRYDLPMRRPTNSIHDFMGSLMKRMNVVDKNIACDVFLRDFREGILGKITLDSIDQLN